VGRGSHGRKAASGRLCMTTPVSRARFAHIDASGAPADAARLLQRPTAAAMETVGRPCFAHLRPELADVKPVPFSVVREACLRGRQNRVREEAACGIILPRVVIPLVPLAQVGGRRRRGTVVATVLTAEVAHGSRATILTDALIAKMSRLSCAWRFLVDERQSLFVPLEHTPGPSVR
jgi:hypothetical protein